MSFSQCFGLLKTVQSCVCGPVCSRSSCLVYVCTCTNDTQGFLVSFSWIMTGAFLKKQSQYAKFDRSEFRDERNVEHKPMDRQLGATGRRFNHNLFYRNFNTIQRYGHWTHCIYDCVYIYIIAACVETSPHGVVHFFLEQSLFTLLCQC